MHLSFQYGETALIWASREGRMECVKVLLDRGAKVNMQDQVSAISFEEGTVREMYKGVRDREDGMVRDGGRDVEEVMA